MSQQDTQSMFIEEKKMTRRVFCVGCKYFNPEINKDKRKKFIWCNHPNRDECNHCELYWPLESEDNNGTYCNDCNQYQ